VREERREKFSPVEVKRKVYQEPERDIEESEN
jgi:hypothetical protein